MSTTTGTAAAEGTPVPGDAGTITFPQGLPGFPEATRFGLQPLAGAEDSLLLLQSVDDADVRFLVMPYTGDQLPLAQVDVAAACGALGIRREDAAVLLVVTAQRVPGRGGAEQRRLYVNLRAPVVLDTVRRTAVQHVLASPAYPVRHLLQAAG